MTCLVCYVLSHGLYVTYECSRSGCSIEGCMYREECLWISACKSQCSQLLSVHPEHLHPATIRAVPLHSALVPLRLMGMGGDSSIHLLPLSYLDRLKSLLVTPWHFPPMRVTSLLMMTILWAATDSYRALWKLWSCMDYKQTLPTLHTYSQECMYILMAVLSWLCYGHYIPGQG